MMMKTLFRLGLVIIEGVSLVAVLSGCFSRVRLGSHLETSSE